MRSNRNAIALAAPVETSARLMRSVTTVTWVSCVIVGAANWLPLGPSPSVQPNEPEPAAVQMQIATEAHTPEPRERTNLPPPPAPDPMPPSLQAAAAPAAPPPMTAVAALPSPPTASPKVVAAGQVASPARIVPSAAATTASTTAPSQSLPAVERLTFGQGEGAQPAPEYPREAALAQQQGTVTVAFTIDESGRVSEARVSDPCRFPLLNQAALRAVRDTWHFAPGATRLREVSIDFQLASH